MPCICVPREYLVNSFVKWIMYITHYWRTNTVAMIIGTILFSADYTET
jgi:hypothetical protein